MSDLKRFIFIKDYYDSTMRYHPAEMMENKYGNYVLLDDVQAELTSLRAKLETDRANTLGLLKSLSDNQPLIDEGSTSDKPDQALGVVKLGESHANT